MQSPTSWCGFTLTFPRASCKSIRAQHCSQLSLTVATISFHSFMDIHRVEICRAALRYTFIWFLGKNHCFELWVYECLQPNVALLLNLLCIHRAKFWEKNPTNVFCFSFKSSFIHLSASPNICHNISCCVCWKSFSCQLLMLICLWYCEKNICGFSVNPFSSAWIWTLGLSLLMSKILSQDVFIALNKVSSAIGIEIKKFYRKSFRSW